MKTRLSSVLLLAALLLFAVAVVAQEEPSTDQAGMPPMGPPEQMKEVADMVGTWDVATKMKMDPSQTEWMEAPATATFSYILDGAALRMDYSMDMMGMPFTGMSITTYDREKGHWQEVWVDNMGGRLTMMTGQIEGDKRVMSGVDMWQGEEYLNRQTSVMTGEGTFEWTMESSKDGGKTWFTSMTGVYTKRK